MCVDNALPRPLASFSFLIAHIRLARIFLQTRLYALLAPVSFIHRAPLNARATLPFVIKRAQSLTHVSSHHCDSWLSRHCADAYRPSVPHLSSNIRIESVIFANPRFNKNFNDLATHGHCQVCTPGKFWIRQISPTNTCFRDMR